MTVAIPLTNRKGVVLAYTRVDDEDARALSGYNWQLTSAGYAQRSEGGRPVLMHREILGLPRRNDGRTTDHKDGDPLDNQRHNLRVATHAENMQNRSYSRHNTSGYRGVYRKGRRWAARAQLNGRKIFIGTFESVEEAGRAAARWRSQNMPFAVETI